MKVGGVTTTEVCNISCSMCHFNGPRAVRKAGTTTLDQVKKYLAEIPPGQEVSFAGTGEFFMDPNALTYLRLAIESGHQPHILTNGQLLTPELIDQILETGVRFIRISVDAIDEDHYRKVRQGGELSVILAACDYLRQQKEKYPDLRVEVNNTLFLNTVNRQDEFIEFWRGRVDGVNFNAEYYDIFKFRNKFYEPQERNDCDLSVYLLPTGQMAPCCAMMVYQHYNNVDWMPYIDNTTPEEAYDQFVKLYYDPTSEFHSICQKCEWWIMWAHDEAGNNPYWKSVQLTEPQPVPIPVYLDSEKLDQLQSDVKRAQETIAAIESSKFWQIRQFIAQFKQRVLGLPEAEIYRQTGGNQAEDAAHYEAELARLNAVIDWMKTSKFWKLRTAWFQVKRSLHLSSDLG